MKWPLVKAFLGNFWVCMSLYFHNRSY